MSDSGNLIMELDNHIISIIENVDQPKMVELIRQEIKEMDLSELFSQADIGESLEQRIDEVENRLDNMPDVDDMKSQLDDYEYKIDELTDMTTENREDWKAVRGEPVATPEVDAALSKQHQRIEELEHAVLCLFEYLFDDTQRVLARGNERFNDSLKGGE